VYKFGLIYLRGDCMSLSIEFMYYRFPLDMVEDLCILNGLDFKIVKEEYETKNLPISPFDEFDSGE